MGEQRTPIQIAAVSAGSKQMPPGLGAIAMGDVPGQARQGTIAIQVLVLVPELDVPQETSEPSS